MKQAHNLEITKSHQFNPSILRAYDIRGIFEETLNDADAFFIGKSFASFLHKNDKNKVVIACDNRKSSPSLKKNLIKGLLESGIHIIDIGVGPTPMLYFALHHLIQDAGIMITGSHNPKNHNGFKMALHERPFYGDDILNLAKIAQDADFIDSKGNFHELNIEEEYIERVLSDSTLAQSKSALLDEIDQFIPEKKLKIVWDSGNGVAGPIMKKLSERIAAEHILLFDKMDSDFPNHHPDPTDPENLEHLKEAILEHGCDFGIAFDGDGDRIGVMDNEGEILWGDQLMVFYSREILQHHPKATIIADVKASNVLFNDIKGHGGNAVMWKTGHSLIKAKMKETKALLAGEMSGHIFFADKYYGFDDALYAAVRLINIVYQSEKSLAELRKSIPQTYSTPEIRVNCNDDIKFSIVEKIKANLEKQGADFNAVDGVRVNGNGGWWLVRASNTQAALVLRCEADSIENLQTLKTSVKTQLKFCNITEIPQALQ